MVGAMVSTQWASMGPITLGDVVAWGMAGFGCDSVGSMGSVEGSSDPASMPLCPVGASGGATTDFKFLKKLPHPPLSTPLLISQITRLPQSKQGCQCPPN